MDNIRLEAIKLWVTMAWCDGSMSIDEERVLELLIRSSRVLTESERAAAERILRSEDGPLEFSEVLRGLAAALQDHPVEVRARLYRAALLLCHLRNTRLSASEQQHLALMRTSLRLSDSDVQKHDRF